MPGFLLGGIEILERLLPLLRLQGLLRGGHFLADRTADFLLRGLGAEGCARMQREADGERQCGQRRPRDFAGLARIVVLYSSSIES